MFAATEVLKQEQGNIVPFYVYEDHINTARVITITRASDNVMAWRWQVARFGGHHNILFMLQAATTIRFRMSR